MKDEFMFKDAPSTGDPLVDKFIDAVSMYNRTKEKLEKVVETLKDQKTINRIRGAGLAGLGILSTVLVISYIE